MIDINPLDSNMFVGLAKKAKFSKILSTRKKFSVDLELMMPTLKLGT